MNKTYIILLCLSLAISGMFAQDSVEEEPKEHRMLDANQLESAKWYYDINEALKDPENVYKLSLEGKKLKALPAELSKLPHIQVLNLNNNKFKELPPEIGDLRHLQHLYIYNNRLRAVPKQLKDLRHLESLYLGKNRLVEVPTWVGGLGRLRTLDVSFNRLTPYQIEKVAVKLPRCNVTH